MKRYLTKANALIANHCYETGLFLLIGVISVLSYFAFVPNKIISSNTTPSYLKQTKIISCAPNSFYNEPFDPSLEEVQINDNRKAAGELRNGIYYIHLEIREGNWYPESKEGKPIKIKALAEAGRPLQVPGPLIRVPEGVEINATITNRINNLPQDLFGFYTRPKPFLPANIFDSIHIEPGETKVVAFNPGPAGTYIYGVRDTAGEKTTKPAYFRNQSYGALVVDAKNEVPDPKERIMVIGMCGIMKDATTEMSNFVINGRSWPYTERLQYRQGELVKWRVINISRIHHPMHLHGFPFTVKSMGKITGDSIVAKENERLVVTQTLSTFSAMRIEWIPEKPGNWLFHCHLMDHILPVTFLRNQQTIDHAALNSKTHAENGMGGLIMGINVLPNKKIIAKQTKSNVPERKLSLVIGEKENYFDNSNGKGFQLIEQGKATANGFSIPGPPLIIYKDQPVAIKIINTLKEPTTIHWHGLEIESYYDGVAGWGNAGKRLAPMIQPGDSFTVHFTPPRAGTFIYHTHAHDLQLLQGMYGPLIVLNPGEKYDPQTDKIFLISEGGQGVFLPRITTRVYAFGESTKWLLNGTDKPPVMNLKKGQPYRFRFINIRAQTDFSNVSLNQNDQLVNWRLLAKDGISLPGNQQVVAAAQLRIDIGETY
ncbi:MAG TPA: multicopper oxidase domain-containing protein, partial [Chitinophagaceae bacterium]|nr:multicopper oxidase domain-containing protein [Chitinophagaceae bacterium]